MLPPESDNSALLGLAILFLAAMVGCGAMRLIWWIVTEVIW